MKRGWWHLEWHSIEGDIQKLTDIDREYIAKCIIDGVNNGEIIQEDKDEE